MKADLPARRYLMEVLKLLGTGLPAKALQVMHTVHDPELHSWNDQKERHQLPLEQVMALVRQNNPRLFAAMHTLDPCRGQGSLGQVHRGILSTGAEIAVKVQYPGIREALNRQLSILLGAAGFLARFRSAQSVVESYKEFFLKQLTAELDYRQEMHAQAAVHALYHDTPRIEVPAVHGQLSTDEILVQAWAAPIPLQDAAIRPAATRLHLARNLVSTFLRQVMVLGRLQSDFHPGNFGLSSHLPDGLVLYDFGSTIMFTPDQVIALQNAIFSLRQGGVADGLDFFISMGFDPGALRGMDATLSELTGVILEPFASPAPFDPGSWNFAARSADILGPERIRFRMAGSPWFLMFMRACAGLMACIRILGAPLFRWDLVYDETCGQATHIPAAHISPAPVPRSHADDQARNLCVRVIQDGEQSVFLQFPALTVESLTDLVPDQARELLKNAGCDLVSISAAAMQAGCVPQRLIDVTIGTKRIEAWLE